MFIICSQKGHVNKMNLTEAINLAKQGRSVGWGIIIKSTYNRKRFITSKYLTTSLEKILSESYVKALSSINLLHNPEVFPSWLGIIIASISSAELKNEGKASFSGNGIYENETWYTDITAESTDSLPEKTVFTEKEIKEISNKLFAALKPEQKMCFLYHYIEGFSVKEISRALRCSENDVISLLNAGIQKLNEICEALKKSNTKLAVFSNSLQLFTFVLEAEYSYVQNAEVPSNILNKIIEDAAAIVAEKEIAKEKEAEEETEEDEDEGKKPGLFSGNKKIIVIIIVIVAIAAGLTIHFVNKGKAPAEPANNSDKPSESDTVSDTKPTMDITNESSTEDSSESTSQETSSSSAPVSNQRPNTSQQRPTQSQRPQSNNNSGSSTGSNSSQTNRPPATRPTNPSTTPTKPTQPSTQPTSAPTQPSTEPSTAPSTSQPDFEIPDIE